MQSQNLELIFTDYLKTPIASYAILINGTWGSGKTFFWKTRLNDIVANNGYKTIYFSLNGIASIDTLEYQLFIRLIPFIGKQENKVLKAVTAFATNTLNLVAKSFLKGGLNDIFKGVSLNTFDFNKYIICFDDLERCKVSITETLGFINNFVEHRSLRTVILSDESKVPNQKDYNEAKEKLIGRIWNFKPDISETLPKLFEAFRQNNTDFYSFLETNQSTLLEVITDCKIDNLRIISFSISILEGLFPVLNEAKNEHTLQSIFFTIIISNEFKKGALKSNDYLDTKNLENLEQYIFSRKVNESLNQDKKIDSPPKTYAEEFYEQYISSKKRDYSFSQSIYTYILTGFLDKESFGIELKSRDPVQLPDKISAYRNLINYKFRELSNDDFIILKDKVWDYAVKGEYSIYDYPGIAAFYYFFSDMGIISTSISELQTQLFNGVELASQTQKISEELILNLMHFEDANPEVTKVKAKVQSIHHKLKKQMLKINGAEFLMVLRDGDEFGLASYFEKYKFNNELFPYIESSELLNTILTISNRQLFNFTQLLEERYRVSNIGELLYEDFSLMKALHASLNDKAFENLGQPRKFLLEALVKTLNEICTHLEKTKKPNQKHDDN